MSCHDTRLLLAFRPNELAADDKVALEAHLNACPACAATARAETAADSAVRKAMLAVPVPAGLRDKLHAAAAAHRGAVLRRKVYGWGGAALAASLLLAVAVWVLPLFTKQPFTTDEFSRTLDLGGLNKQQAVAAWLKSEGLPEKLPDEFEYGYHAFHGTETLNGRKVPVVVFQNGQHQCRVYVLRRDRVDVPADPQALAPTAGSRFTVKAVQDGEWLFVIAYTSDTLDPFLRQAAPAV